MDKLIELSMALVIAATLFVGFGLMSSINDGRIATVVNQLTHVQALNAQGKPLRK